MSIKRGFAFVVASILFWAGDLSCKACHLLGGRRRASWIRRKAFDCAYRSYQGCMQWSADIQDWGGASGPWSKVEES